VIRQRLLADSHSQASTGLRNVPEFHAAWNVQPGDRMYLAPERRVRIW